jgi:DNA excision repair protein ERCC-2
MPIHFRHEQVRPFQKDLMEDMHRALNDGQIFMTHAPTGLGKTDAALSAAITYALEEDKTVFFLTPKISQHKIAMDVVNGIAKKHSLPLRAVDMVGRSHCCIEGKFADLDNDSFQRACARKRRDKDCLYYVNARGHGKMGEAKAGERFARMLETYGTGKSHHELIALGSQMRACPYEWLLKLGEISNVVVADYYHLVIPHIRDIFLSKIKKRIEDSVVIIDEAHNLASRVRGSLSIRAGTPSFHRMVKEMRFLGLDAGPMDSEFDSWAAELMMKPKPASDERWLGGDSTRLGAWHGGKDERAVSKDDFGSFFLRFGLTMEEVGQRLEKAGMAFIERTDKRSACLHLSSFISEWEDESRSCVRILKRKGDMFFLSKRLLDPSSATSILNDCDGAMLMSGSLLPMQMHRDVLGLDPSRTVMKAYSSPFDPANSVNIITENITTRYSKRDLEGYTLMAGKLDSIVSRTPGGTAVFFPSYEVMGKALPIMRSRNLIIQKPGMKPQDIRKLIKDFKGGGVLCGVQGGSLSEGVDFSEGEIKTVVIVGVALEEIGLETKALIEYYDREFGRGWDYGYLYPGTIKALQAAGRARRKESDRVAVVFMDERFKWGKYNWILNKEERIVVSADPEDEVQEFWSTGKIEDKVADNEPDV